MPPQLVVVDGRMRGASFDVPPGRSEIGRQAGVAILLDDQDVSRHHAVLERTGNRVVLTDPGSTNGTWVNRRRLRAGDPRDRVELRDGDELLLASVTLRFSVAAGGTETAVREYAFGDVNGPVQTGSGQQYTARAGPVRRRPRPVPRQQRAGGERLRPLGRAVPRARGRAGADGGRLAHRPGRVRDRGVLHLRVRVRVGHQRLRRPRRAQRPVPEGAPARRADGRRRVRAVRGRRRAGLDRYHHVKAARKREEELRRQQRRWQRRGPDG